MASQLDDDDSAAELRQHGGVVGGEVRHTRHEDDRRAEVLAAGVEIVDSGIAVVDES